MRVLVTGWHGYIGPVVVRRLIEARHYVTGLDTHWFAPNYAEPPTYPHHVIVGDIRDFAQHNTSPDVVVHLAGLSNDPLGDLDPELTHAINVNGTIGVLNALPSARHIIVSSCAVYGANPALATEETPPNPLTRYALAKWAVDDVAHTPRFRNAVSLRLGTVWGYSPGHRLDLVVNRMVYDAVTKGRVIATGNAARPIVHVEDVADAVSYAVTGGFTGIYNVVGENVRMHDLATKVANYGGVSCELQPPGPDARDYMANGTKLWMLSWNAKRSLVRDLPDLFTSTIGLPPRPDTDYMRLPALQQLRATRHLDDQLRTGERIAA